MIDAAAQQHDYAYNLARTGGVSGALWNDAVGSADRALASAAINIIDMYGSGINDSITNRPITLQEYHWAQAVAISFAFLGDLKAIGNMFGR
jgi:hypothetical protein